MNNFVSNFIFKKVPVIYLIKDVYIATVFLKKECYCDCLQKVSSIAIKH